MTTAITPSTSELVPRMHPTERREAERYVDADGLVRFVERQRLARLRVTLMDAFYLRYPCRMGALHRLAGAAIGLARFCGVSEAYSAIGTKLCPVDADMRPRSQRWTEYVAAFESGAPADVREEIWLRAHLEDVEVVRAEGWMERFEAERALHEGDPMWAQLKEHMDVTLGTRLQDEEALAGEIALETAIAGSLARVVARQLRTGLGLVRIYAFKALSATLAGGPWVPPHLPSDRRLVWALVRSTIAVTRVSRVWRLGVRHRARGAEREGQAWSMEPSLRQAIGDTFDGLHPDVARFFAAMSDFEMTASVHLYHRLGRHMAWLATLFVGQGMYEEELTQVPARFRLFRRDDGSLHFRREFWCDEVTRVFDSDFVVREVNGVPTILEVFVDLGIAARMRTEVMEDGGLSMTVAGLFVHGLPVPVGPFRVCFETRPASVAGKLDVQGVLDVQARGGLARWFWHRLMGMPERIGEIRYYAELSEDAALPADRAPSATGSA